MEGVIVTDDDTTAPQGGEPDETASGALDVQLARDLIERAQAEGVSLAGPGGLLPGITRTVLQAALEAERTDHLGYDKGDPAGRGAGNHRNGSSAKTVQTEVGPVPIEVPRGTGGVSSSRRSCPSTLAVSKVSTRLLSRCMPRE